MAIRKNKTPTRSRKQAEFKVLGEASYGNPERLGRALMRCIEYLELVGYGATMTGGEENRTCMDVLLKGMHRRGKRHGVPVVITVKPSMYNGMNESIRALLADPHAGIEGKYDFDIPEGETVNNLLHGGKTYYDILEEYGYRITAMEALIEFFLKNQNADPGQKYCNMASDTGGAVAPGMRYSCLSDILDMSRQKWGGSIETVTIDWPKGLPRVDYQELKYVEPEEYEDDDGDLASDDPYWVDDEGNEYSDGEYERIRNATLNQRHTVVPVSKKYPEVIPEVIAIINNGAVCQSRATFMPCLQKILSLSSDAISAEGGVILSSSPFITHLEEYNWKLTSSTGMPVMQELINECGTGGWGSYVRNLIGNVISGIDTNMRSSLIGILSEDYDFRNVSFGQDMVSVKNGTRRMTGIDYCFSTGILLPDLMTSRVRDAILTEIPLCRYDDSDNLYSCFAKMLNGLRGVYSHVPSARPAFMSETEYLNLIEYINAKAELMPLMERNIREGDCSVLTGTPSTPLTCMDVLVDIATTSEDGGVHSILQSITSKTPLSEMTCIDERAGNRTINCLDKMIGEVRTPTIIDNLTTDGVILSYDDCTDSKGNRISCIDKLTQRQELWVYAKFRARQLKQMYDMLLDMKTQYKNPVDDDLSMVNGMREGLEKASLDMNLGGDIGFRSITRNYDVGALKSHTPCSVTPSFKRVIEEEISSTQYFMNQRGLGYPSLQEYSPFDAERINYARELLKSINTEGSQRDYPIVSRMMRMYDANNTERRRLDYMDAVSIGVTDLLATDRLDSLTLNAFECRDKSGKTISCMQKLIEVSRDLNNTRKNPRKQTRAIGYRDEYSSLFAIKDMYKSNMCDAADGSGKRSCLEFVFEKMMNDGTQVPMDVYIAIMSNRDFNKYADTVINVGSGNIALRDVVCQNVKLFDLGDYLVKTKTLGNVGNNRPRFDNLAANLHSMCKGCDKIKDPLDKRLCMDADLFDENGGFLAGKEMNHMSVNEKGQSYGGYSYNYSRWANDYAKDPEASMSHFRYRGSDDIFGLAGVYRVTYDPSKLGLAVNVDRFDYESVVRELVFPAIERTVGKRLSRFKKYHDVQIETYTLDRDDPTNYKISVYFTHRDESGNQHDAVETYNIPEMFSKGGLISSDDMKKTVIRTKDIADSIRRISTMKSSESKDNVLTMTISNRPSDFMRASTGQPWTSCMGFRQFPGLAGLNRALLTKMNLGSYIAFVSGDDLDGGWKARMILVPSMEHPMEVVNGSPTNMFRIEEPYGLPQFTAVMQAALRIIMRENGYNAPGSYSPEAHGGRQIEEYIYNSSNPDNFADSVTRRGGSCGDQGTGSRGGRRRAALMEELWDESLSKCIEKVASGTAFSVGSRSFKKEEDCGFFLDEKISKHEMSPAYVKTLFSKGLLSKDLERNYRYTVGNDEDGDSYFFFGYDGILEYNHVITTVDDKSLEYSKKLVSVEKIKPLTTVRGRGVPV